MSPAPAATLPTNAQFLAALNEVENFSPAPVILSQALALLRDPMSDIDCISDLVASDAVLAADLVRCANSAYYGSGKCRCVEEAVQKIGFNEAVHRLNLAVARIASSRDLRWYGITGADFWAECLFNGIFLHGLAQETGNAGTGEAYTVGLLRFIGRLAINQTLEKVRGGLRRTGREPILRWERESVGVTQAQAGALLLRKWRFPESIVQAIAEQDAPMARPESRWLAAALGFASEVLPQGVGQPFPYPADGAPDLTLVGADFMRCNRLTPASTEHLLQSTGDAFDHLRRTFGV